MEERDWSVFACPNPDCSAYGQRGLDNIRPHGWSSKARGLRCLRCSNSRWHLFVSTWTVGFSLAAGSGPCFWR
jgi:hypothetical protein